MDTEWETIVTATIAVVGSIVAVVFGFISTQTRNLIEGLSKRVDQVEQHNEKLRNDIANQQLEIEELVKARKNDEDYISILQAHINDGKPPPPPERPSISGITK